MAIVHWSGNQPHLQSISVDVDEVAVAQVTEVYICRDESMAADALNFTAYDVSFPIERPRVTGSAADRLEGGMWQVTRNFSGLLDENLIGDYKVYKASTIVNREPIQTHPNFNTFSGALTVPAGGGTTPQGALFDENGFIRFVPFIPNTVPPMLNTKAGVVDYLAPIITYSEDKLVFVEDLPNEVNHLGFIDTPPDSVLKPSLGSRTWVLTKAEPEHVAEGTYKLKRQWSMGGPRGWDTGVYSLTS